MSARPRTSTRPATPPIRPAYLGLDAAAAYSGLSTRSLRRLIADGRLRGYHPVPGRVLVAVDELDTMIRSTTGSAPE